MASTAEQIVFLTLRQPQLVDVVRRFCACVRANECRCGLPRPASGWTVERLTSLRALMREHGELGIVAAILGESTSQCNRALFALIDRTPVHALAALEAKVAR